VFVIEYCGFPMFLWVTEILCMIKFVDVDFLNKSNVSLLRKFVMAPGNL
jgi:hypothetical protein